jgi:hypothetical protein
LIAILVWSSWLLSKGTTLLASGYGSEDPTSSSIKKKRESFAGI